MNSVAGQTVVRLKDFRVGEVGNQVSKTLRSIAGQVADGVQNWTSKAKTAARTTDGAVRSSPWQVAGAVALVGLAAGILVSRSARRARRAAHEASADSASANSSSELSGG
jgi:ElaB/YqjD/DUF883 family membrane-anchored ribosome-binding protein